MVKDRKKDLVQNEPSLVDRSSSNDSEMRTDQEKIRIKGRKVKNYVRNVHQLDESDEEFFSVSSGDKSNKNRSNKNSKDISMINSNEDKSFGLKFPNKLLNTGKILPHWNDCSKIIVDMKIIERTNTIIQTITSTGYTSSITNPELENFQSKPLERWSSDGNDENEQSIETSKPDKSEKPAIGDASHNVKIQNDQRKVSDNLKGILDDTLVKNDNKAPILLSNLNSWFSNISSATKLAAEATKIAASATMTHAAKQIVNAQNILLTNTPDLALEFNQAQAPLNQDKPHKPGDSWDVDWDDSEPIFLVKKNSQPLNSASIQNEQEKPNIDEDDDNPRQNQIESDKTNEKVVDEDKGWDDWDEEPQKGKEPEKPIQIMDSGRSEKMDPHLTLNDNDGWDDWDDESDEEKIKPINFDNSEEINSQPTIYNKESQIDNSEDKEELLRPNRETNSSDYETMKYPESTTNVDEGWNNESDRGKEELTKQTEEETNPDDSKTINAESLPEFTKEPEKLIEKVDDGFPTMTNLQPMFDNEEEKELAKLVEKINVNDPETINHGPFVDNGDKGWGHCDDESEEKFEVEKPIEKTNLNHPETINFEPVADGDSEIKFILEKPNEKTNLNDHKTIEFEQIVDDVKGWDDWNDELEVKLEEEKPIENPNSYNPKIIDFDSNVNGEQVQDPIQSESKNEILNDDLADNTNGGDESKTTICDKSVEFFRKEPESLYPIETKNFELSKETGSELDNKLPVVLEVQSDVQDCPIEDISNASCHENISQPEQPILFSCPPFLPLETNIYSNEQNLADNIDNNGFEIEIEPVDQEMVSNLNSNLQQQEPHFVSVSPLITPSEEMGNSLSPPINQPYIAICPPAPPGYIPPTGNTGTLVNEPVYPPFIPSVHEIQTEIFDYRQNQNLFTGVEIQNSNFQEPQPTMLVEPVPFSVPNENEANDVMDIDEPSTEPKIENEIVIENIVEDVASNVKDVPLEIPKNDVETLTCEIESSSDDNGQIIEEPSNDFSDASKSSSTSIQIESDVNSDESGNSTVKIIEINDHTLKDPANFAGVETQEDQIVDGWDDWAEKIVEEPVVEVPIHGQNDIYQSKEIENPTVTEVIDSSDLLPKEISLEPVTDESIIPFSDKENMNDGWDDWEKKTVEEPIQEQVFDAPIDTETKEEEMVDGWDNWVDKTVEEPIQEQVFEAPIDTETKEEEMVDGWDDWEAKTVEEPIQEQVFDAPIDTETKEEEMVDGWDDWEAKTVEEPVQMQTHKQHINLNQSKEIENPTVTEIIDSSNPFSKAISLEPVTDAPIEAETKENKTIDGWDDWEEKTTEQTKDAPIEAETKEEIVDGWDDWEEKTTERPIQESNYNNTDTINVTNDTYLPREVLFENVIDEPKSDSINMNDDWDDWPDETDVKKSEIEESPSLVVTEPIIDLKDVHQDWKNDGKDENVEKPLMMQDIIMNETIYRHVEEDKIEDFSKESKDNCTSECVKEQLNQTEIPLSEEKILLKDQEPILIVEKNEAKQEPIIKMTSKSSASQHRVVKKTDPKFEDDWDWKDEPPKPIIETLVEPAISNHRIGKKLDSKFEKKRHENSYSLPVVEKLSDTSHRIVKKADPKFEDDDLTEESCQPLVEPPIKPSLSKHKVVKKADPKFEDNDWNDWSEESQKPIMEPTVKPSSNHKVVKKADPKFEDNDWNDWSEESQKPIMEPTVKPSSSNHKVVKKADPKFEDDSSHATLSKDSKKIDKMEKNKSTEVKTNKPKFKLVDHFEDENENKSKSKPKFAKVVDDWDEDDGSWNEISFSKPSTSKTINKQNKISEPLRPSVSAQMAPASLSSQQYQNLQQAQGGSSGGRQVDSAFNNRNLNYQTSGSGSWLDDFKTATRTAAVTTVNHAVRNWSFNPVSLFDSVVDNISNAVGVPSAEEMATLIRKQQREKSEKK